MPVRRSLIAGFALVALLFLGACGSGDRSLSAETDDPLYADAKRLERQGRYAEALLNYEKLIEKRGEHPSPESHFDAGIMLLNLKNPLDALHHLNRYLTLEPNSPDKLRVREMINQATKEFARTLPARPMEDQSLRLGSMDDVEALKRENAELRAQLQSVRGNPAPLDPKSSRGVTFTLPSTQPAAAARPVATPLLDDAPRMLTAPPVTPREDSVMQPAPMLPVKPAPAPAGAQRGKKYVVKQGEGLFTIAHQFASTGTNAKMQEIIDANRDVLPNGINTPLKPGMELRIP